MRPVIAAVVMAVSLGVSGCVSIAEHARPERLPIIDLHTHLNGDMEAKHLLALMDRTGVRTMVLMARYYRDARSAGNGSDEQALEFARRFPGRFIPFVAGQRGDLGGRNRHVWEGPTQIGDNFLRQAERKLQSGHYFGLGEFILRHYDYSNFGTQGGGEVDLPVDSYLMHRIAALGAKYAVPVLFHLEAEPEQTQQAVRLFEAPETTFIWAHNCGRASADQIRQLLGRYPRLMCDLGGMMVTSERGGYGRYWPKHTPYIHLVQADGGKVYPEMLRLFEDFSDRFLLGTDTAHTPALRSYEERIHAFRQMLSQMTPATARRIAYQNAERLFATRRVP